MERLAANLRELRQGKGFTQATLAERAGLRPSDLYKLEGELREPRTTKALKLAHALGVSLDELVEGIFWVPGQVQRNRKGPPPAERLAGFFVVLPANEPAFATVPPIPVSDRHEVARILGANIRDARKRRHLTQSALGRASNLSREGLSLIEQGVNETTVETLLALACSLNLPPGRLLDGVSLEPQISSSPACEGRAHRPTSVIESEVARLWREDKPAAAIAETLGVPTGTVSYTVHRLRERGAQVPYRRPPTRLVHARARRRRESCAAADHGRREEPPPADRGATDNAATEEIAARIGANLALWRAEGGVALRQLAEATEIGHAHLFRAEKNDLSVPNLTFVLRLAGSLNVPASAITAGVDWSPTHGTFRVANATPLPRVLPARLGHNVAQARHKLGISQQALADRASMGRSEVSTFERWSKNFRVFTLVRLASALELSFDELFEGVANWHFLALPPPEFLPGEEPTKQERDQQVIHLWRAGRPETEIAEALDLAGPSIGAYIRDLRDAGVDLPYRRPPRSAAELSARRRRRGAVT